MSDWDPEVLRGEAIADSIAHAAAQPDSRPLRAKVLDRASKLICGKRQQEYGPPHKNFARIADAWNWWLASTDREASIRADDVAVMMALLKLGRLAETPGHLDSYVDGAGYLALAAELARAED